VYDADLKGYFDTIPHDQLLLALKMRITDRSVLRLIQMWLKAPVQEEQEQGRPKLTHPTQGTPQGGVISPLLANLYLHWFEKLFHGPKGPATWANARLVRYADDFVILARHQGRRLRTWVEGWLEGRFGLRINRDKTRVVDLQAPWASFDFLGFTFRYDPDRLGRRRRYLNVHPSKKAVKRARAKLRELTDCRRAMQPIPELIGEINAWLSSWSAYYRGSYTRMAFRAVNYYAVSRLTQHLRRRSQRPYRPSGGRTFYAQLQSLGLKLL
jgi:RNA-directed DNA polymerase